MNVWQVECCTDKLANFDVSVVPCEAACVGPGRATCSVHSATGCCGCAVGGCACSSGPTSQAGHGCPGCGSACLRKHFTQTCSTFVQLLALQVPRLNPKQIRRPAGVDGECPRSAAGMGVNGALGLAPFLEPDAFPDPFPGLVGWCGVGLDDEVALADAAALRCFFICVLDKAAAPSTSPKLRLWSLALTCAPGRGMSRTRTVMLFSAMGISASSGRTPAFDGASPPRHASESCLKTSLSARSTC